MRKPKYPEATPETQEEHTNSANTGQKPDSNPPSPENCWLKFIHSFIFLPLVLDGNRMQMSVQTSLTSATVSTSPSRDISNPWVPWGSLSGAQTTSPGSWRFREPTVLSSYCTVWTGCASWRGIYHKTWGSHCCPDAVVCLRCFMSMQNTALTFLGSSTTTVGCVGTNLCVTLTGMQNQQHLNPIDNLIGLFETNTGTGTIRAQMYRNHLKTGRMLTWEDWCREEV